MISLLVLSHSKNIALGVKELAGEVSGGAPIYAVGGSKAGTLGSDFDATLEALEQALQLGEVVALADIGSTLLTLETAIDTLEPRQQERVHLSRAALVEGSVLAAVAIAGGQEIPEILEQLEELRLEK